MRFTVDSPYAVLTNRLIPNENFDPQNKTLSDLNKEALKRNFKHTLFGKAKIQLNVKLGQLYKSAMYEETSDELEEYANFMTQVGLF